MQSRQLFSTAIRVSLLPWHKQSVLQCLCGMLARADVWFSVQADYYEEEGGEGEYVEEDAEALEEYEEGADEGGILL